MMIIGFLLLGLPSGLWFGLFLLLVGFASILSWYGLLKSKKWIRPLATVTSIGCLGAGLVLLITPGIFLLLGLATVMLGIGTLVYLRRNPAK